MPHDAPDNQASAGTVPEPEGAESLRDLRVSARRLMREAEFESALPLWLRVAELAPEDGEPRMALARIHARCGRPLEALDRLAEVLKAKPHHADALKLRSNILRSQLSDIGDRIGVANAADFRPAFDALEERVGSDPDLQRARTYADHLAAGARKRPARAPARRRKPDAGHGVEGETLAFLNRMNALGTAVPQGELEELLRQSALLIPENVWLTHSIALFHARRGDVDEALRAYRSIPAQAGEAELWLLAARRAVEWRRVDAAAEFCAQAAQSRDAQRATIEDGVALLVKAGAADAAAALWRGLPSYRDEPALGREVMRLLVEAGSDAALIDEAAAILAANAPFGSLGEDKQNILVDILRLLRRAVSRARLEEEAAPLKASAPDDGSPFAAWILGTLAALRLDHAAAIAHFRDAAARGALPGHPGIDLDAEIALLYARFHQFGRAHAALGDKPAQTLPPGEYGAALRRVRKVVAFCGAAEELLFPEGLIDVIFSEIAVAALAYEPCRGHLVTVTSSLRQGGSERQTVTVLGRMAVDPRVKRAVLAVRSTDEEDRAPFLRVARGLPIELVFYGRNWQRNSDLLAELPRLAGRDRLIGAIDLLPRNLREDIVRLSALILAERPQAVHLRQDLFAGAIACALTAVPRFVIHRGSLSPDLWGHGELETNLHLRPMRHTYRHLLALPNFAIVNNSSAGTQTDRAWTQWPDPAPFHVIHNAVEFEGLGSDTRPDPGLRAQLGIPRNAFVVGGVFRVTAVKRPLLWIETARLVAEARPDAHFVVLGDGEMASEMRGYAQRQGFAERLHMPGLVSDVGAWFRIMDANLLTSDREGLPNVLIEGQHFGVPAVSADVGGAFETIERGVTGHLIAADGGAQAFAAALLQIAGDPAWREAARRAAPAFVHGKFGSARAVEAVLARLGMA